MFSLLISYYIILHLLPESKKILNPVPNQHTILDSLPIPTNISQVIIIIPSYLLPPCFKLSFSLPLLEVRECQSFNNRSHWIDNWIQAKMIQLFELTFSWELHHPKVISIIIPLTARKKEWNKKKMMSKGEEGDISRTSMKFFRGWLAVLSVWKQCKIIPPVLRCQERDLLNRHRESSFG